MLQKHISYLANKYSYLAKNDGYLAKKDSYLAKTYPPPCRQARSGVIAKASCSLQVWGLQV